MSPNSPAALKLKYVPFAQMQSELGLYAVRQGDGSDGRDGPDGTRRSEVWRRRADGRQRVTRRRVDGSSLKIMQFSPKCQGNHKHLGLLYTWYTSPYNPTSMTLSFLEVSSLEDVHQFVRHFPNEIDLQHSYETCEWTACA